MTTRESLLSERSALIEARAWMREHHAGRIVDDALTASIARIDLLLSLSDEQVREVFGALGGRGHNAHVPNADAYRIVAELIRRTS